MYSAERGRERYSVTVVDYSSIEQQGIERAKSCPPGNANCRANAPATLGAGYAHHDERGAIVYATFKLLQRDAKLNQLTWEWQDLVEGHIVQLTNADQSRTFAWVGMHQHKLYIIEGTVPAGYPEPGLFQQSMQWVDKDGKGIRYQTIYSNSFHALGVYPCRHRRPINMRLHRIVAAIAIVLTGPAAGPGVDRVRQQGRPIHEFSRQPEVKESTYSRSSAPTCRRVSTAPRAARAASR